MDACVREYKLFCYIYVLLCYIMQWIVAPSFTLDLILPKNCPKYSCPVGILLDIKNKTSAINNRMQDKVLSCNVCLSVFDLSSHLPRVLPSCGHTICQLCLGNLLQSQELRRCPLDKTRFPQGKYQIDSFPINFTVKQLLEEKKWEVCQLHQNKIRLLCLNDRMKICEDCLAYGPHKAHDVIPLKDVRRLSVDKAEELEQMLEMAESSQKQIHHFFEKNKANLIRVVESRFQEMRWLIDNKQSQIVSEIHQVFSLAQKEMDSLFLSELNFPPNLDKTLSDLKNMVFSNEFIATIMQKMSGLRDLDSICKSFFEYLPELEQFITQATQSFSDSLAEQMNWLALLRFPSKEFLNPNNLKEEQNVEESIWKSSSDSIVMGMAAAINVAFSNGYVLISDLPVGSENQELKRQILTAAEQSFPPWKVYIKLGDKLLKEDMQRMLLYYWVRLVKVCELRLDLDCKNISDEEFSKVLETILWRTHGIKQLYLNLENCSVGNNGMMYFSKEILPRMSDLRSLKLNLKGTQISKHFMNVFEVNMKLTLPNLNEIESIGL